jgi:hypothetical protein
MEAIKADLRRGQFAGDTLHVRLAHVHADMFDGAQGSRHARSSRP